jgi:C-terminal processing protease CtpA/Prc
LKQAFSTHTDAKGWIIDLRGNGGGNYHQSLYDVLKELPRPLAVIIDAGCFSAGETLARDFVRAGRARLFGPKTAGASSAKRIWTFPSGIASLSVPTRSRWGIDGKPIEFLGIEPHVKVEAVPEELKRGLNSAILRAEEYITEITSAQTQ